MKKHIIFSVAAIALSIAIHNVGNAQTYDAKYVHALYAKYPTKKSNFCPACKIWVNPYYTSIADTQRHMPLVEHQFLTKANYALTPKAKIARTGVYSNWSPVLGQPSEDKVYTAANKVVKAKNPKDEIAKGHVNCWIVNAWCADAAILSDTYTFNAAFEDQSQNVGTEIATENITRKLLATNDVEIWGGTFGSQGTFTDGKITGTYPAFYWKIIKCNGTMICYWMPNLITETQAMLPKRVVTFAQLVANLKFDPTQILK